MTTDKATPNRNEKATTMNNNETYECGSLEYCDIANDEAGCVCEERSTDKVTSNELYEQFCGQSAEGVDWPEVGTEGEIRKASREEWEKKLAAAGY
jgi:hypothetical protein